ncbi:MAG: glycosyltransferase family 2 protein [Spirosomataceae bacterium]
MTIEVSVILVGYHNYELMRDCLTTLFQYTKDVNFEVIVADNASSEAGKSLITSLFPTIKWIDMGGNVGFSKANNRGMMEAKGNYFLLLNADTLLPDNNLLLHSLFRLNHRPDIAACSVQQLNKHGQIAYLDSSFAFRKHFYVLPPPLQRLLNQLFQEKKFADQQQVDWLSGAYLFVRRESVEKAGMMDEDFFLYAEDVEWCYRLGKTGKLMLYNDLEMVHLENELNPYRPKDTSYINRFSPQIQLSNLLWVRKQFGVIAYLSLIINYLLMIPVFYCWKIILNLLKAKAPFQQLENQRAFAQKTKLMLHFFWDTVFLRARFYKVSAS